MNSERYVNQTFMYEYKEIVGKNTKIAFLLDCYESFGWEIDDRFIEKEEVPANIPGKVPAICERIVLRRLRKIINKAELIRLQRNFESCIKEIEALEHSKTSTAQIASISTGMIGTAFMAGSVFAITGVNPMWVFGSILGIVGFIGWTLPVFIFRKVKEKKSEQIIPLIEAKYDEIETICEKGNKLLFRDNNEEK